MPRKRRVVEPAETENTQALSQQDESDILAEAGVEPGASEAVIDEDKIKELGAVDADTVRANRRELDYINRKRAGDKGLLFNAGDLLARYEAALKLYHPNTLDINVKRTTGTPVQTVIRSRPRSGAELYDALMKFHGTHAEAEYEVKFFDTNGKQWRGCDRITLPDTQQSAQPQGQPMNAPSYYVPPGYPPPVQPGYPPASPPGYPSAPAPTTVAPAPQGSPQPVVVQAPPAPDMAQTFASFRQLLEMFQGMQQPTTAQAPILQPSSPAAPDMGTMLTSFRQLLEMFQGMQPQQTAQPSAPAPAIPAGPDMGSMMALFQQLVEMSQRMQPPTAPGAPPTPNPMMAMMGGMMGMPPVQPPPGTMWVPGFGFMPVERLVRALTDDSEHRRGPYREREASPRPMYRPQYDDHVRPAYQPQQPPPQPQRSQSPMDQFREAVGIFRAAAQVVEEVRGLVPDSGDSDNSNHHMPAPVEEDDSPVRIVDTGPAKLVTNKSDGSLRFTDTMFANLDKIFKFAGEQRELIQNARAQQKQRQQLPPGYVEVDENYRPPPGWVAVPEPLPPPPQHVPPPISQPPPPQDAGAPSTQWNVPTSYPGDS